MRSRTQGILFGVFWTLDMWRKQKIGRDGVGAKKWTASIDDTVGTISFSSLVFFALGPVSLVT
jgi:hypothetical protein